MNSNSSKMISEWILENTGGKLGDDSADFSLDKDGVMELINTVSFYDEWIDSFDKKKTEEDIFYLQNGKEVNVEFMNMIYPSHGFAGVEGYTVSQLSAFISIDEKGVEAAAFTQIDYAGSALPEGRADMILNRPFIFIVTGIDRSPLFIGIVNNPNL